MVYAPGGDFSVAECVIKCITGSSPKKVALPFQKTPRFLVKIPRKISKNCLDF